MKKRRLCIVAFWLCLALPQLVYPMIKENIDSENYENRTYAAFPEISWQTMAQVPRGLEAYYNDRVPFKNQFTRINTRLQQRINQNKSLMEFMAGLELVTVGQEGWLYYTTIGLEEDSIRDYLGNNLYTEEELRWLAEYYQRVNDYFQGRGIEFVLFVPPNKEQIYDEYMPKNVELTQGTTRMEQATHYLKEHTDVNVIFARDALLEAKKQYPVYYKYDSHWNSVGAFVGVQLLTELLQEEAVPLAEVEVEQTDAYGRDLAGILGIVKDCNDDHGYSIQGYKKDVKAEVLEKDGELFYHFQSNAKDQRRVLVLHDSFAESMRGYLAKCFGEVTFVNDSVYERAKELLDEEPPDIFILEIVERRRQRFGELAGFLLE